MAIKKFKVQCEMDERWVNHFLSLLNHMQYLGDIGSSRVVGLYSDGDGDFRPKFATDVKDFEKVEPKIMSNANSISYIYDAG